jgi:hypothetical protein
MGGRAKLTRTWDILAWEDNLVHFPPSIHFRLVTICFLPAFQTFLDVDGDSLGSFCGRQIATLNCREVSIKFVLAREERFISWTLEN